MSKISRRSFVGVMTASTAALSMPYIAFGAAPRMRLDLLVNDFVYKLMTQNYLVVYEKNFMRTFIHIKDIARSFLYGIEKFSKMKNQVYNVGNEKLNYSKEDICNIIKTKLPGYIITFPCSNNLKQNFVALKPVFETFAYT